MNHYVKESWKQLDTFESYVLLGPSRNLLELSRNTNVCLTTLRQWCKFFKWNERCGPRDRKAIALIEKENDKILVDVVKKRHIDAYKAAQEKAVEQISQFKPKPLRGKFAVRNFKDTTQALDIAVQGERKSRGMNDSHLKAGVVKEGFVGLVEVLLKQ
jgi:hypothetical protein